MTHTIAQLNVSRSTFDEVGRLLRAAGYDHAFNDGVIDMTGIGLVSVTIQEPFMPTVMCVDCREQPADSPSTRCPGCDAYKDHTAGC